METGIPYDHPAVTSTLGFNPTDLKNPDVRRLVRCFKSGTAAVKNWNTAGTNTRNAVMAIELRQCDMIFLADFYNLGEEIMAAATANKLAEFKQNAQLPPGKAMVFYSQQGKFVSLACLQQLS